MTVMEIEPCSTFLLPSPYPCQGRFSIDVTHLQAYMVRESGCQHGHGGAGGGTGRPKNFNMIIKHLSLQHDYDGDCAL